MQDTGPGRAEIRLSARHRLAGTVAVAFQVELLPLGPGTRAGYRGQIQASGLAGRLLKDRMDRLEPFLTRAFDEMRARIEAPPAPNPAQGRD